MQLGQLQNNCVYVCVITQLCNFYCVSLVNTGVRAAASC